LFSSETGEPLAIFPDGIVQRFRVGACNGLGIRYLAREDARDIGMLGSGWQAGTQLMAACATRSIETVRVFSPNRNNRETFARDYAAKLGIRITPVDRPEDAVTGADIVLCATNVINPVFFAKWIEPGMHITSIKRPEIAEDAIKRADIVVLHSSDGSPIHTLARGAYVAEAQQEGKGWKVAGSVDFKSLPTLPDLIAGRTPRRTSPQQVTCFLNNIGLGFQFAAAGALVYRKVKEAGLGHELPTEWFTEDVHP
jgi:ornithine cyclodeaminase/alanine dehydrogenase-like protein (mu-crystallin family)